MILVTGATGFIGRRLVARLVAEGHRVRALVLPGESVDLLTKSGTGELDGAEIVRGDVRSPSSLQNATRGASRVYHLAAVVGDWGDDALFQSVNVEGTRNVLDAAVRAGCERVLQVSSIVVYGSQLRGGECDESAPREYGVGPYSRSKRASEQLALDYHDMGRVPVTVVRPGNVYGPASPSWVDEVASLLKAGSMILIDGGAGDAVLAYVDNVVDVIVRAGASQRAAGQIFNVNDGSGVTWRQYLTDLAHLIGVRPPRRSVSFAVASGLAAAMEVGFRTLRSGRRPLLTTESVALISSRNPVPIRRAVQELDYCPIRYDDAMQNVAAYLQGETR